MKHETPRKPGAVGASAATGRGPEGPRVRPRRDRPPPEDHAAERLRLAAAASARRRRGPGRPAGARPSFETDGAAEAGLGGLPSERSVRFRVCHGPLDLPPDCRVDSLALGHRVPRRRHSSGDGRARFFPLKGPNGWPLNATKKPSAAGSNGIGRGSNAGRPVGTPTWFSLMKRASCCIPWFAGPGRHGARHPSCGNAPATTGASRPSAASRSRRAAVVWDGICGSIGTRASARSRSSLSCATCSGTCAGASSWCGITSAPTAAEPCVTGCAVADACTWSSCPATPRNSIRTSTGGLTSRRTGWQTTAHQTWTAFTRGSWSRPATRRATRRCSARSFMQRACLYGSANESSFYRDQ